MNDIKNEICKKMLKDIMLLNGVSNIKKMGVAVFSLLTAVAMRIQNDNIIPDEHPNHQDLWCYSRVVLEIDKKDDLALLYKYINMKA